MIENCGKVCSVLKKSFSCVACGDDRPPFISEPVPGSVSTTPSGTALRISGQLLSSAQARRQNTLRGRDELRGVNHGTAAHGKEEIDILATGDGHGFQTRFVLRIGLDAAELDQRASFSALVDLGVHAVALNGAAAVGHEDFGIAGHERFQFGDGSFAEDDASRVVVGEVQHDFWLVVEVLPRASIV